MNSSIKKLHEDEEDEISTRTDAGVGMQVPFALLLPCIQSHLDKDRAMQLRGLYDRLKSNEINKKDFARHVKNLVGEHVIKMALYKFECRKLSAKQNTQDSSPYVATSTSDSSTLPMVFPHSSFSTNGNLSGNYQTGASPNSNMSSLSLRMRQGPVHPIRIQGGSTPHFTSIPNLNHWQPSMVSAPHGQSSFSPGQHGQTSGVPGSLKDSTFEMSSRPGFSTPMNVSAGNMSLAAVSNAKTPPKRSTVGQKKQLEVPHISSLSKKPKVCGAFSGQSIDELNDVTAVSGVNLREEEEQLFGGSKDQSRVSEASRKIVQEEEERLFLQKVPLQTKMAEIMAKCGVKDKSIDVERCISQCVKERMHGLITNLIRVSKQRVDIEKPRPQSVITSDVWKQIMSLNQKAREEWEEKQADANKLQRADKVNKEKDDEMTAAANVAARAALGGDDMLSKWQLRAEQARKKHEIGPDGASVSEPSVYVGLGPKPVSTSERTSGPSLLVLLVVCVVSLSFGLVNI